MTVPYFLELMPTRLRGKATVYLSIGWPIGVLAAVGTTQALHGLGWRVVVIASGLAGIWIFAIRAWVPKSPYWIAAQGRHEEARGVLQRLGARVPAGVEFAPADTGEGRQAAGAVPRQASADHRADAGGELRVRLIRVPLRVSTRAGTTDCVSGLVRRMSPSRCRSGCPGSGRS